MEDKCVRVEPPIIKFNSAQVGQVYKTKVTVTNVGKQSKKIIFQAPSSKMFKFIQNSCKEVVAPGLHVSGLLEFSPETEERITNCLIIHVDSDKVEVPIEVFPVSCCLIMTQVVDFGCVAATCQIVSKKFSITNCGFAPGMFQVQDSEEDLVKITPSYGLVAANATQWITVELRTDVLREINKNIRVRLQDRSLVFLNVRAKVVDHGLEIFDLQGSPLSCLWFGPVYFGTSTVETVVLKNNAPQTCDWVCVLQDSVLGTELATDLQRSTTTDTALLEKMQKCSLSPDIAQVFMCSPMQGRLGAHEKTTLTLCFSPGCKRSGKEKQSCYSSRRQDYSIFLLFDSVGRRHGFIHHNAKSGVELAVTGSGLPVSLVSNPSQTFDFPPCATGQSVDMLCVLQNLCPQLPVNFRFRKLPHFIAKPTAGTIASGKCKNVIITFAPRQQGSFQMLQKIDALGQVRRQRGCNPSVEFEELQLRTFYTITLRLSATCCSKTMYPLPQINPGISPLVTNPIGLHPYVPLSNISHCREIAPVAILSADKTKLHKHCRVKTQINEIQFVAFPNDRAESMRPSSPHRQYRTIFTDVPRHHYVDTSYAFTPQEKEKEQQNKQVYADLFHQRRQRRLEKLQQKRQEKFENDVDIGIEPAQGLVPPKLVCKDQSKTSFIKPKTNDNLNGKDSSTSKQFIKKRSSAMSSVPSTSQEVAECDRSLTSQELYQVIIEPLLVDFGEVCVRSVCTQRLEMINRLSVHVWVQLQVDCSELQGSSPISYVLTPHSHSALTLTFQSHNLGEFYRTVPFTVNKMHPGQILVQAQVVPVALELSTDVLVLQPASTWLARSGYRGAVTLKNHRNHPAEFNWKPVVTESGILFSMRPASGVVDAYKQLDCEVVWHSSFSSPVKGDFDLCVREGNKLRLHCVAKLGCTTVQLMEKKRVTFESIPLNMTSVRTAVLRNTGPNHAFFQVLDVCPLPGMVVSPAEGLVPRGGQTVLSIHFIPDSVIKFDVKIEIALKGMESIKLRVGGIVEPPNVELSVSHFQLCGVCLGSRQCVPFILTNRSSAPARVTFDLSEYSDFSVRPTELSAESELGVIELQGHQKANCSLVFFPTQVASYNFELPMSVNGIVFPRFLPFSLPASPATFSTSCTLTSDYSKATVQPVPLSDSIATESRCIEATVICAPLEICPSSLHINVTPLSDTYTKTIVLKAAPEDSTCWSTLMKPDTSWWIDCSAAEMCMMDEKEPVCTVSPSSGRLEPEQSIYVKVTIRSDRIQRVPGAVTDLILPVYLGEKRQDKTREHEQRYRALSITLHHLPHITILPPQLLLTPVPLGCNMTVTVTLVATGYSSGADITAEVSDVELENGRKQQPIAMSFPQGSWIPAQDKTCEVGADKKAATSVTCNVSFCSLTPVNLSSTIVFKDQFQNRFKVKVFAVADNCLLTVWPYVALHRSEQQIVLKAGATTVEAVLQDFHIPSVGSFSSSSTFGLCSSIKKLSCADSFQGSVGVSDESSNEQLSSVNSATLTNCGVPEFLTSSSELGLFYQNVLVAVERWFSLFGWANGPYPISVPETLRRVESNIHTNNPKGKAPNTGSRSVVDMVIHLTGREVPGVPHSQSISDDLNLRTYQLIQMYEAILDFLRVQGAHLCYIRPEYLLDKNEFKHWCSLQMQVSDNGVDLSTTDYESMSKRSWTDVLLQIYRVFILCRVSGKDSSCNSGLSCPNKVMPTCLQPLASNLYSPSELHLLSWLNMHYESMRKTVWTADGPPPARWIVNFDLDLADGLVLAALLAAYCPYLIFSHFRRMYTKPSSLEEILHNNIVVVQALTTLALNMDIYPTDLTNPNPVQMLMLCVHLNKKLPQYQPTQTIILSGELHSTINKQIHLTSPVSRPIKYKALLLGDDAHLFSLPGGLSFTISAKSRTELTIHYNCTYLQPKEAALLLFSSSTFGAHGTLAFHLKGCVTRVSPMETVKCNSPCYKQKLIQLMVTNSLKNDGNFKITLVDCVNNPLQPSQSQPLNSNSNPLVEKMTEGKLSDPYGEEDMEFSCVQKSVLLKSGHEDTLNIIYMPFNPGSRYCCVLLTCPQIGDMVYLVKAIAGFPHPLPLTAKSSQHIDLSPDACVSVLSFRCKMGEVCEEIICLPIINMAWEQALASWGQSRMSAEEHRRRSLTHTLHSSTVRRVAALLKFRKQQAVEESDHGITYSIEVSSPQYFTLPSTVTMPVNDAVKMPWENPADCGCVEVPVRFKADSVGTFTCKLVLRSWCDTRVYMLKAIVTAEVKSAHLNFNTPAHCSVTQYLPFLNDIGEDLKMKAEVHGEGFSGPDVFIVVAGTKACYPLTFHPVIQQTVMGKLTLNNECNGDEHIFTLRGVGERSLPVDHLLVHCPVGRSTDACVDVPNYSKEKVTLKVETDLSMINGPAYVEIEPGETSPYTLTISPKKRGTYKEDKIAYEAYFTIEIICEAPQSNKNIEVKCQIQSSVAVEIPVNNPHKDKLDLDIFLEGHGLSGDKSLTLPPHKSLNYKVIYSPFVVGKSTGSVVFQSDIGSEFWYHLELYALPLPVTVLPEIKCQLGKCTRITLPVVNPTSEPVQLNVSNSNPHNYTLEMDFSILSLEPHSSSQLGVRFSPSTIGEGNHMTQITFSCPQLGQWSVSLSGCGLNPECEKPVSILSKMGSSTSITITFTNPMECQAVLDITLTDEHPNENKRYPEVFTIPMSKTRGVRIEAGASIDIPVVFTPTLMDIQKVWLCITMDFSSNLCINSHCSTNDRSAQDLSTICWIYPLCGIPTEVPVESSSLGLIQCEAGCQLEKKVDVLLAGCVLGNQEVTKEDFLCEVHSDQEEDLPEVEDSLSVYIETATRDSDTGIIKVTLQLVYCPLKPRKTQCHASVIVTCVSGGTWDFPIALIATKPVFDDVIHIEATKVGQTSAVGIRLTSTTRSPEPFTAVCLPGSSSEFTVTPASGMLPPITSTGALITVSFTPSSNSSRSRARLQIKAAEMQWVYEVKGSILQNTPQCFQSQSRPSSQHISSIPRSTNVTRKNFVARNLRIPGLAKSSPLKIRR